MIDILHNFLSHFTAYCMEMDLSTVEMEETAAKLEFAVNMGIGDEVFVEQTLRNISGIKSIDIDPVDQSVLVSTTLPSNVIQDAIESTGMLAVLRGQGGTHLGAAVSVLRDQGVIKGLVRFTQVQEDRCVIDGSFSGIAPGRHGLHIHELGDLSEGYSSTGDCYNPTNTTHGDRKSKIRHIGDLGNIEADVNGASSIRFVDDRIKVWDIIGRSVVVHDKEDDMLTEDHGGAGKGIAYGIIARSSGLFENKKKVCACSGKTIWEEREDIRPLLPT